MRSRNTFLVKLFITVLLTSLVLLFASDVPNSTYANLDDRSFEGDTGIKDAKSDHIDVLRFKNGKFKSKRCEEWGFTAGDYKTTIKDNRIYFEAYTQSEENGTLFWKGFIEDKKLKAKYIWTKKILFWEIKKEYWFDGVEINKEK